MANLENFNHLDFMEDFVAVPEEVKKTQPKSQIKLMPWMHIEVVQVEIRNNGRRVIHFEYQEPYRKNRRDAWGVPSFITAADFKTLHVGHRYLVRAIRRDKAFATDKWVQRYEYEWIQTVPLTPDIHYWGGWDVSDDHIEGLLELEVAALEEE
jgi:hypothetical protein